MSLVFLGYIEVESEFALERRDRGFDISMKCRLRGSWSGELVQHHADAHEDAPELCLHVEHPSWPIARLFRDRLRFIRHFVLLEFDWGRR